MLTPEQEQRLTQANATLSTQQSSRGPHPFSWVLRVEGEYTRGSVPGFDSRDGALAGGFAYWEQREVDRKRHQPVNLDAVPRNADWLREAGK